MWVKTCYLFIAVRNAIRVEEVNSESHMVTINSDFLSELQGVSVSISLECDTPSTCYKTSGTNISKLQFYSAVALKW